MLPSSYSATIAYTVHILAVGLRFLNGRMVAMLIDGPNIEQSVKAIKWSVR